MPEKFKTAITTALIGGALVASPPLSAAPVTVYQYCNYGGFQIELSEGKYDTLETTVNDQLSAIKVESGYEAILYQHAEFKGEQLHLTGDDSCFVNNGFNDLVSSIEIVKLPVASADTKEEKKAATGDKPQTVIAVDSRHERQPLFGDLHVHTNFSLDSYFGFNPNGPREAYHFARGGEVNLFASTSSKLKVPLDFAAVTDHAEHFGKLAVCTNPELEEIYKSDICVAIRNESQSRKQAECNFSGSVVEGCVDVSDPCDMDNKVCKAKTGEQWLKTQHAAKDFNAPGQFTTFVAYEWSAGNRHIGSFHRNVIFRNHNVPNMPFHSELPESQECSSSELKGKATSEDCTPSPEKLWQWLQEKCTEENGCEVLTIPHNSNMSYGSIFREYDPANSEDEEDAILRQEMEPLVEIFQTKGDSECRLGVGTHDELCNFEKIDRRRARNRCPKGTIPPKPTLPVPFGDGWLSFLPTNDTKHYCVPICREGSDPSKDDCAWPNNYVRNGLKDGLAYEQSLGVNPFKYGIIASTDTHSGTPGATEEDQYNGHHGASDNSPEERRVGGVSSASGTNDINNPGGLAGVWAEENTRDSIFDALKRRETFGTSGTRIKVRLFGGWNYADDLHHQSDMIKQAYKEGVPMGSDLPAPTTEAPKFLVWATKAPNSANLQRIQIIKGWLDSKEIIKIKGGKIRERVYDVACSDGIVPDPRTRRCPYNTKAVRNTVNLDDCSYSSTKGAVELKTTWTDPDFDPSERAFYYVRVVEYPTCRWSQWDVARTILEPLPNVPQTIQERAWSSPIWYSPSEKPLKKVIKKFK